MFHADVEYFLPAAWVEHDSILGVAGAVALESLVGTGVGAAGDVADDDHVGVAGDAHGAHADAQVEDVAQLDQCCFGIGALFGTDAGVGADGPEQDDVGVTAGVDRGLGQCRAGFGSAAGAVTPRAR